MPTNTPKPEVLPVNSGQAGPAAPSETARARAAGIRRRAEAPPALESGLLPDALEELNATIEELRVAEEEMRVQNEELLLARQRVEAERHRYQDLFEFAPDGYLVTTLEGKILEANRAASHLFNIAPRFLKGRGLGTSVAPQDLTLYSAQLQSLTSSTLDQPQEWTLRLRRRHVGLFPAAVTVAPVAPLGRQPATLRWMIRDVTNRRQAEEEQHTAERVQRLLLPTVPADTFPHLSVETVSQAAASEAEIGGGFCDVFALAEGKVALVAATLTAEINYALEIKYALRVLLRETREPAIALARLNDSVDEAQRLGDFDTAPPISLALVVADASTGEAVFAAAGGGCLLVLRTDAATEAFGSLGRTLGIQPGVACLETRTALGPGDTLLLFTGGLTESGQTTTNDLLRAARLTELAEAARGAETLRAIGQAVLDAARASFGGTLGDAACLLLARRRE